MGKKKILISGVGGSLFPYFFDKLDDYEAYFTDSNTLLPKIYPNKNIIVAPLIKSDEFEPFMTDILTKFGIDYYVPLIDEEIPVAHKIVTKLGNVRLISPALGFCELCMDKSALMDRLDALGISSVSTFSVDSVDEGTKFPIFAKPITGRGSRGAQKIESCEQMEAYLVLCGYEKDEIMVQEFLDGDEYTVSVVVNTKNRLLAVVPKRIVSKKGITQNAVTVRCDKIEALARRIVEELQPCGSFNIQLMMKDEPLIFEINPRFSTTTVLTVEAGIDELALAIKHFDDENAPYTAKFKEGLGIYRSPQSYFYE